MNYVEYAETPFSGTKAKNVQISNDGFLKRTLNALLESYDKNFDSADSGLWALMQ